MTLKKFLAIFLILLAMALAVAQNVKVCVTPSGKKYHLRGCRTLAKSKTITELTVEQAKARGYEACKVCYRPCKIFCVNG